MAKRITQASRKLSEHVADMSVPIDKEHNNESLTVDDHDNVESKTENVDNKLSSTGAISAPLAGPRITPQVQNETDEKNAEIEQKNSKKLADAIESLTDTIVESEKVKKKELELAKKAAEVGKKDAPKSGLKSFLTDKLATTTITINHVEKP